MWNPYRKNYISIRQLIPYFVYNLINALNNLIHSVLSIQCTNVKYYNLKWKSKEIKTWVTYSKPKKGVTFGLTLSKVPFSTRHSTFSTLSHLIPKLRQWSGPKKVFQMSVNCKPSTIQSPRKITSGSFSLLQVEKQRKVKNVSKLVRLSSKDVYISDTDRSRHTIFVGSYHSCRNLLWISNHLLSPSLVLNSSATMLVFDVIFGGLECFVQGFKMPFEKV